ncbi:uncharacterized protein LOC117581437 [Drosophila guanche]|uniref:Blast:G2/M phase-specific E3 ubiquitin-protein ligase n=1 Tax=Drosophila guanche TaxID=7266 RepID=A0A3B0JEA4_DROGU|nr:uncharacterized protein LOC117581437 [Drosophila guanche]SPP78502.1 blast:G2/M phase-specific E3 ubiquitin-protein ligase [Drosophila guanche]
MVNCMLCGSSVENVRDYGPSFHYDELNKVHRNCLYLSSNLVQRGDDNNGISRFLKEDILAEVERAKKLTCHYCNRSGASIGCCKSSCRRSFHFSCGLENLARNQFCGSYKSYCHSHVGKSKVRPPADEKCPMCLELVVPENEKFRQVLAQQAPCCRNGWFHKKCLQDYAHNAGYFFKCPLCNSSSKFMDVCLWGVSVPNRDASWETEPNAFHDQLVRDLTCTASSCIAVHGRNSDTRNISFCQLCGSNAVHSYCVAPTYVETCQTCSIVDPPSDDSEDEFEMFARREALRSRSRINGQNRSRYQDKLRAPSTDEDADDDNEDCDFLGGLEAVYPPLAAPAAGAITAADSVAATATVNGTDTGSMTTDTSSEQAAATAAPPESDPMLRTQTPLGSLTRARAGHAVSAPSNRKVDQPVNTSPPQATVTSSAAVAAARQRNRNSLLRHTMSIERESRVQRIGQRRRTMNSEPFNGELRSRTLRRQGAACLRQSSETEIGAGDISCIARRTRKRTAETDTEPKN